MRRCFTPFRPSLKAAGVETDFIRGKYRENRRVRLTFPGDSMWQHFSPRLRRVVAAALQVAGQRGHEHALPEHLLLALAADTDSSAAFLFERVGITLADITAQIDRFSPRLPEMRQRAARFSDASLLLLNVASAEINRLGHGEAEPHHLALAMIRTQGHMASDVLGRLGFTAQGAEKAMKEWELLGGPKRRDKVDALLIKNPWLRTIVRPIQAISRPPMMLWKVYFGRSLANPQFVTNPYPIYRWLRDNEPIRKDPLAPVWIVTRYEDVAKILTDPRFRKDPFAAERIPRAAREQLKVTGESARSDVESVSMLFLDPPEHTRVRSMFTQAFSPKALETLRPRIEQIARKRLDQALGAGNVDVIRDLAYPLPVMVIAELLGFPPEDYERIKKWSDDMTGALSLRPSSSDQARAAGARENLRAYFDQLVPVIKKHPREDLLSTLLSRESEPGALNREEIFSNAVLLLAAGHETTTNLIGNAMLALLQHPDQLKLLRDNPALMPGAVDEFLRYDSPVQWTSRVAGEAIDLGGHAVERGQIVLASLGAANHDPAVFTDPEQLDIRRVASRHIAFGQGPHYCLGAALAKMEASIAITLLLSRFPNLRLKTTKLPRIGGLTFRGVKELPVKIK
jgi:cytochrome P450